MPCESSRPVSSSRWAQRCRRCLSSPIWKRRSPSISADLYVYDTDLENRAAFKELLWDAVMHSLVEHHGFKPEDL